MQILAKTQPPWWRKEKEKKRLFLCRAPFHNQPHLFCDPISCFCGSTVLLSLSSGQLAPPWHLNTFKWLLGHWAYLTWTSLWLTRLNKSQGAFTVQDQNFYRLGRRFQLSDYQLPIFIIISMQTNIPYSCVVNVLKFCHKISYLLLFVKCKFHLIMHKSSFRSNCWSVTAVWSDFGAIRTVAVILPSIPPVCTCPLNCIVVGYQVIMMDECLFFVECVRSDRWSGS